MKTKNIILYIVICLIVIAGLAVWKAKGFSTELHFSSRKQIQLSNNTGINIEDINEICKEALGNTEFVVQPVENFGNSVIIVARDITDEQRNKIVESFNKKYETELKNDKIEIESIPFIRVKDLIEPVKIPGIISLAIILVYFIVRYKNIGWKQVTLKTILAPIVAEFLLFSIIAITRLPFGRTSIACGVGLYFIVIFILTVLFEKQKSKLVDKPAKNNN